PPRDEGPPRTGAAVTATEPQVRAPDPVDWATARRVARFVSGHDPLGDSYLASSLAADFDELTPLAESLVPDYTGLRAPGRGTGRVADLHDWIDSSTRAMQTLLDPLMQKFGERLARSPFSSVSRRVAAGELGGLLGYMSQRVLGQYDLLVPDHASGATTDAVY